MLLGELDIDGAGFLRTISSLDGKFAGFLGNIGKFGAIAGGSFAAFQGVQTVLEGFKETLDLGGHLSDLSAQTGEAIGDLVILRQTFELAGIGANSTGETILKLQDSIAGLNEDGKSTASALKQLGTSATELRNMPAIGQIQKLQEGFQKLEQTTRVAVARDLFGKSGGKMLSLFTDSSVLDAARQQAGPLAEVMDRNAASFDKLGDVIAGLKLNFQEFFAGALSQVAPEATSIAEALESIDFVGIGESVGALANVFLSLVGVLAELAPLLNALSEGMSLVVGSGSTASAGLAEKYRGLAKLDRASSESADSGGRVSALQKIGGGFLGGGADPYLDEQRSTNQLLARLVEQGERAPIPPAPVPPI